MTSTGSVSTGWSAPDGAGTTLVLLRHGVTAATERRLFSGGGGADHALTADGHEQAERAAAWILRHHDVDAVVASPLLRTRETAAHVAAAVGCDVEVDDGFVEAGFGDWDGHTFAEISARWPDELAAWLASTSVSPPQGEAFDAVAARVDAACERLVAARRGETIVVVSHVTPIKLLVRAALGAPISAIYAMELSPASVTTVVTWPDDRTSLRTFNVVPE